MAKPRGQIPGAADWTLLGRKGLPQPGAPTEARVRELDKLGGLGYARIAILCGLSVDEVRQILEPQRGQQTLL